VQENYRLNYYVLVNYFRRFFNSFLFFFFLIFSLSLSLSLSLFSPFKANNTAISNTFENIHQRFTRIFKRRAHVHHYTEYMEEEHFFSAEETLLNLVENYKSLETAKPSVNDKNRIVPII